MMDSRYEIKDTSQILTPALIVFREILEENLDRMIRLAGSPDRLRPHCKTHKMREVIALQLARGIARHKASTFAEAEMLARCGVKDVFLSYSLVGPNIARAVIFRETFPDVTFSVTADHEQPIAALGDAMQRAGKSVEVLLDIDSGQRRTGVPAVGMRARELYGRIVETPGLVAGGLHLYDGQNHQRSLASRRSAVLACWKPVDALRNELVNQGWPVPRIVAGGTASFPVYASIDDPLIQCSPGTCVFSDIGYGEGFPDLEFTPAAALLTRVISRTTACRMTLDLGYKAVASDPPAGDRLRFPDLPDAKEVLQNEEHLVLETASAEEFEPGDELLALPQHICPTSALHKQATVIAAGEIVGHWSVAARDRQLEI